MTVPTLLVEIRAPGGTGSWVNITGSVLISAPVTITRGRENERAVASPSTCSLTLDNAAGTYTEGRTVSGVPWGRWTQLRVTVNGQRRFTGVVTDLDQDWPAGAPNRATVRVVASGMKAYMAASPNLKPWIEELYEDLLPVLWWPLDDPPYAEVAADRAVSVSWPVRDLQLNVQTVNADPDGVAAFGESGPTWLEGGSMLRLSPRVQLDSGGWAYETAAAAIPTWLSGGMSFVVDYTVLVVHQPDFSADDVIWGARTPIVSILGDHTSGRVNIGLVRQGARMGLEIHGSTEEYHAAGTVLDGVPRLHGIVVSGGTARVLGTSAAASGISSKIYGLALGKWDVPDVWVPPAMVDPDTGSPITGVVGSGSYSNLIYVKRALTDVEFADLRRLVEGGYGTDLEWLQRAADYVGLTGAKVGPTRQIARPNLRGSNPAAIGDGLAAAWDGDFVEDAEGVPTLVDHRWVPTQATVPTIHLDAVDADQLRWGSDPTLWVTEAGRGERIQASRTGFPRSRRQIDDGLVLSDAQRLADWLVNSSDVSEAPRLTGIKLDMLAASVGEVASWEPLAYLIRPRIRIDVASLPPQLSGLTMRTMTVEGSTEVISGEEWSLLLSTAPDPRLILGDPVQGVLGVAADNRLGN